MRILALLVAFSSLILETSFGIDLRDPARQGYYDIPVSSSQPVVDRLAGYKEAKKLILGKTSGLVQEFLGESYWTQTVAPIVMESIYSVVEANASGHLRIRDPLSVLDDTANRFAVTGRKELSAFSEENLPQLPLVGNLVQDLTESQNLSLHRGNIRYRMQMRKRFAPEFKFGKFSFSGGTEAYIHGSDFSKKSLASIGYKGLDSSCQVQLYGRNIRLDASWSSVDLRLDWKPEAIKIHLALNIGSWL